MKTPILLVCIMFYTFSNAQILDHADTFNIETASFPGLMIEADSNNLWQVGKPNKTLFKGAHSGSLAIVTDTAHPYPANNNSQFQVTIHRDTLKNLTATFISFMHRFDTDTLKDICFLDAANDTGVWYVLNDSMVQAGMWQWEDWLTHGDSSAKNHFSGSSNGWVSSTYTWMWYTPVSPVVPPDGSLKKAFDYFPDSIRVRFNFISDSINTNKDGWMIDDLVIGEWWASGIEERSSKDIISVFPNPANDFINITFPNNKHSVETIAIRDIAGKMVMQVPFNRQAEFLRLNIQYLKPGQYFIEALNGKTCLSVDSFIHE